MGRNFSLPPYPMQQSVGRWIVVVPVRGRLTPMIWETVFANREAAETWINSADGRQTLRAIQTCAKARMALRRRADDQADPLGSATI